MYFPDNYVPGSSERMLLYRELDNIERDEELEAYRQRLIDRFGPVPRQGEELMLVVPLRRVGRRLGCEKIILRQGRMQMQFVSNTQSALPKRSLRTRHQLHRLPPSPLQPKRKKREAIDGRLASGFGKRGRGDLEGHRRREAIEGSHLPILWPHSPAVPPSSSSPGKGSSTPRAQAYFFSQRQIVAREAWVRHCIRFLDMPNLNR